MVSASPSMKLLQTWCFKGWNTRITMHCSHQASFLQAVPILALYNVSAKRVSHCRRHGHARSNPETCTKSDSWVLPGLYTPQNKNMFNMFHSYSHSVGSSEILHSVLWRAPKLIYIEDFREHQKMSRAKSPMSSTASSAKWAMSSAWSTAKAAPAPKAKPPAAAIAILPPLLIPGRCSI